jgi:hypothetical protein
LRSRERTFIARLAPSERTVLKSLLAKLAD